jgi:hypothetical protein
VSARPPRHASIWFPVALTGVCLVIIRSESSVGLTLKFLFSKLVYSTSDGAVLFFLTFCLIALLIRHQRLFERVSSVSSLMLGAGLVLGYGTHLTATLVYLVEHRIPLGAHVYHWSSGSNSYTSLLHSHQGKAAMTLLGALFSGADNYDAGAALAGTSATGLVVGIGVGFLMALVGGLLRFPLFFRAYEGRPTFVAAYLIVAAVAIKSVLDGGLLAYSVPPALLLLASFVACPDPQTWSHYWRKHGWLLALLLLAAYLGLWIRLTPGDLPLIGAWLAFNVVLVLLMTAAWRTALSWILRVVLVGYLGINLYFDIHDNLAPLLSETDQRYRAAQFDVLGQSAMKDLSPWIGQPVFKIYRAMGDDPWKPRKTLIWVLPAKGIYQLGASLLLLDWDQAAGQLASTPSLRVAKASVIANAWIALEIVATAADLPPVFSHGSGNALSKNNYYVWLYQMDGTFRQGGWRSYVMLPHTSGNFDADATR